MLQHVARNLIVLDAVGKNSCRVTLALVPLHLLKPHEEVIENRVDILLDDIRRKGVVVKPVLVDVKTMVILDGHHRVEALKRLGAVYAPALLVDYDSPCVSVYSWRKGITVTKQLVRTTAVRGQRFPPRTSRHVLSIPIPSLLVRLDVLRGRIDYRNPMRGRKLQYTTHFGSQHSTSTI